MSFTGLLLTIAALSVLAVRDFLSREIEVYWFLVAALCVFIYCLQQADIATIILNLLVNAGQVIALMAGLLFYYNMRERTSWRFFFEEKLGMGDCLFWMITGPLFTPVNFICWMIISLLVCLFFQSIILLTHTKAEKASTIPLAGIQSVTLVIMLLLDYFDLSFDLMIDLVSLSTLY